LPQHPLFPHLGFPNLTTITNLITSLFNLDTQTRAQVYDQNHPPHTNQITH